MFGVFGGRESGFVDGGHGPVSLADVFGLRGFELVDRPEDGQPPVAVGGGEAGQVRGVDDENGVKFEADRAGLDVAHAGEEERGEDLRIGGALVLDAVRDLLEDTFTRGIFEEADEGFDFGMKPNDPGIESGFSRSSHSWVVLVPVTVSTKA